MFGYVDNQNFWVRLYSKAQQKVFIYQVSSGTWTQKSSGSFTITNGVAFGIEAEARSGAAHGYAATVPAGQVGLWCSHASANAFDNFKVRDLVGPFEADGRWFSDKSEVAIDESNNNLLRSSSATSTEYYDTCIVRRGFRAGKYVATFRFKWAPGPSPGFLVRWVNPGDWVAVMVKAADGKAWLYKRVNDGILQSPLSSGWPKPALVARLRFSDVERSGRIGLRDRRAFRRRCPAARPASRITRCRNPVALKSPRTTRIRSTRRSNSRLTRRASRPRTAPSRSWCSICADCPASPISS